MSTVFKEQTPDKYLIDLTQTHMNCIFRFTISVDQHEVDRAERVLAEAHVLVGAIEEKISEFIPTSDVAKLLTVGVDTPIEVSAELIDLLEESARVSIWSGQVYNPAFRSGDARSLQEHFQWEVSTRKIQKHYPHSRLGFGAMGKGYALDRVKELILQAGFKNFRLNAGGSSLIFSGQENHRVNWKMGFGWKKLDGKTAGTVFEVMAPLVHVGVSGEMEQGKHILNAASRTEATNFYASVLIAASSAARADGFSTSVFADPDLLEKYVDGSWAVVDNEDTLYRNAVFQRQFNDLDS